MALPNPFALKHLPVRRGEPSNEAGAPAAPPGKGAPTAQPGGLLGRFLQSLPSKETRRGYRRDLERFFEPYLRGTNEERTTEKHVRKVTREEILYFLNRQRQHQGYSKNTIRHRAAALRSFYKWLNVRGHVEELPFGSEEGSTKLMKAALKAGGEGRGGDSGGETPAERRSGENRPNKKRSGTTSSGKDLSSEERRSATRSPGRGDAGTEGPNRSLQAPGRTGAGGTESVTEAGAVLEEAEIPADLLGISTWIPPAISTGTPDLPDWEKPSSVSLRDLPATIYRALQVFSDRSRKARRDGQGPNLKILDIRRPEARSAGGERLQAQVRHLPQRDASSDRASQTSVSSQTSTSSRTSGGEGEVWAGIKHPRLKRIQSEGPGPSFDRRSTLEMLAALYAREWSLPDPLYKQLQRMVEAPLELAGPSARSKGRLPSQVWGPAGSEAVWEQAATEAAAALENAFRLGREETLSVQLRSRP